MALYDEKTLDRLLNRMGSGELKRMMIHFAAYSCLTSLQSDSLTVQPSFGIRHLGTRDALVFRVEIPSQGEAMVSRWAAQSHLLTPRALASYANRLVIDMEDGRAVIEALFYR